MMESSIKRLKDLGREEFDNAVRDNNITDLLDRIRRAHIFRGRAASSSEVQIALAEATGFHWRSPETLAEFKHRWDNLFDKKFVNLAIPNDMFPREQIRVYLFEEWNADPAGTLRSIFRFLDVDENVPINVERRNVTHRYRSQRLHRFLARPGRFGKRLHRVLPAALRSRLDRWNQMQPPPMPPELWRELTEGYREDILNLQARIGRDLSHWLKNDRPGAARG